MATITLNVPGPQGVGTFGSVDSSKMVFTSTTLANGATLTTTPPWASFVDPSTATTVRVPLDLIVSVV